jgi:Ala-tRNA(Pro) deacylase
MLARRLSPPEENKISTPSGVEEKKKNMTVEEYLYSHNISFVKYEHEPVYTCEEAEKVCGNISGFSCKNLFLTNTKADIFILVLVPANEKTDLKKIAGIAGEKRLTFAKDEKLHELMQLNAGAVSIFGLINDKENKIELMIDKRVYNAEKVKFHPNRNNATLQLNNEMFHKYINIIQGQRKTVIF